MAAQAPLLRIGLFKFLGRFLSHFQIFLMVPNCNGFERPEQYDHHGRTKRICPADPYPDAGHPSGRAVTTLGYPVTPEKRFWFRTRRTEWKRGPLSARVNNPKNNDADIVPPIELESVVGPENNPHLFCFLRSGWTKILESGQTTTPCASSL
jgi:hypothetical protein